MATILIIDDERPIRSTLKEILEYEGYSVELAENGPSGWDMIQKKSYDLIYSDIKMPGMDGIEVLNLIKTSDNPNRLTPIVLISGHANVETAVDAIKKGAFDLIEKPIDLNRLIVTTKHALALRAKDEEIQCKTEEIKSLKQKIVVRNQMIGETEVIKHVKEIIHKVAPTDARVLITGESGTGKEVAARMLHEESQRAHKPLIEVNCAAIPSELIESELFGHIKGSFTGAIKDRAGKFEQADGGTLFLDEIGDMSLAAQTKVLRALQENEITRVGSDKSIHVNVRVIAATNKNLLQEIEEKNFREDLFHRLNVIPLHMPSLDERKEDIPALIEYFTEQICKEEGWAKKCFTNDAIKNLQERTWSGNIRELRNVVERLIILSSNKITEKDIHDFA